MMPLLRLPLALVFALLAQPAETAPTRYLLEPEGSTVGFVYELNGAPIRGQIPVLETELLLDFDDVRRSRVAVLVDARQARAGVIFATEAMKGATVLDVEKYPEIVFRATGFQQTADGARVTGDLTIRGVTQPVTLNGRLFRGVGSDEGDFSRLTVRLTGVISRKAFGADGFPKLVGDLIALDIIAALAVAPN